MTTTIPNDQLKIHSQRQIARIRQESQKCNLLGRSAEESILLNAYFASLSSISASSEVPASMVLICGESGQGKTKLAESLRSTVLEDDGYFIRGKFDQNISYCASTSTATANLPYSGISAAFGEYFSQLEQRGDDDWKEAACAFKKELRKDEVKLLTEAIPSLSKIFASKCRCCGKLTLQKKESLQHEFGMQEDNFSESRSHRLNMALKKFAKVISKLGDPILLLIDDMQWADESSLEMLKTLVLGARSPFIFVFTYRPVDPNHPFLNLINELQSRIRTTEISLPNLEKRVVHELVGNILSIDQKTSFNSDEYASLSNFIFHVTHGNPFFVRQQIISFCNDGLLCYDGEVWVWDIEKIKGLSLKFDVVGMLSETMKKLPPLTQFVLTIMACIGSTIDLGILLFLVRDGYGASTLDEKECRILSEQALSLACEEGLLMRCHDDQVTFIHDSIQSAAYSLLDPDQKISLHLKIGRILRRNLCPTSFQKHLFTIANQLARGHELIVTQAERIDTIRIFIQAGDKLNAASACHEALFYFEKGTLMVHEEDWIDHFRLCCDLFMQAAEVAANTGDYEKMEKWLGTIFQHSRTSVDDLFRAYYIKAKSLFARKQLEEAIDLGTKALLLVGEQFPKKNLGAHAMLDLARTRRLMKNKSTKELLNLPPIKDKQKILPILKLLDLLCTISIGARQELRPFLVFRVIQLNLKNGLSTSMPTAMSRYAWQLICFGYPPTLAAKYARIALDLQDHLWRNQTNHNGSLPPETMADVAWLTHGITFSFTKKMSDCIKPLKDGFDAGIKTGDITHAMVCLQFHAWNTFHSGKKLSEVKSALDLNAKNMSEYGFDPMVLVNRVYIQTVANFSGGQGASRCPSSLSGDIFNHDAVLPNIIGKKRLMLHNTAKFMQMLLACFFGDYDLAWAMSEELQDYGASYKGIVFQYICAFYRGFAALSLLRISKQQKYISTAKKCLKMLEVGQKKSPLNLTHHYYLLNAEYAVFKKKHPAAEKFFVLAINEASNLGVTHEHALACEQFGLYLISQSKHSFGYDQIRRACQLYAQWGSTPKCDLLCSKFSHLDEDPRDIKFKSKVLLLKNVS